MMASTVITRQENSDNRCHKCRYWFDRCCHALALLEGDDKSPGACLHFVTEAASPHPWMEISP